MHIGEYDFLTYKKLFEIDFISGGVLTGVFLKEENVSLRNGSLAKTKFGDKMGAIIESPQMFAIDYYGYVKKSAGLYSYVRELHAGQVKIIKTILVHFAALTIECIAVNAPELAECFPRFKKDVLGYRGFQK